MGRLYNGQQFHVREMGVLELGSGNRDMVFGHNAARANHILFIFTTIEHLSLKIIVCVMHVYVYEPTHLCMYTHVLTRGQSQLSSSTSFSKTGFLTNLEFTILANLAGQEALRVWPIPPNCMVWG